MTEPLSDDAYRQHVRDLRTTLDAAPERVYTHYDNSPRRRAVRQDILDDAWSELGGDDIPKGRQGLILAGVPGSAKTTIRTHGEVPGVGKIAENFLPLDSDYFKGKLIDAGLAPQMRGFSPMESAPLMHKESNDLAKMLAKRAYQQGTNVVWDNTLRHPDSGHNRLAEFDHYGYTPHGIYAHVDPAEALRRVTKRHRDELDQYLAGLHPHGGRYVPDEIIRDSMYGDGRVANRDHYDRIKKHLATSQIFDTNTDPMRRIGGLDFHEVSVSPWLRRSVRAYDGDQRLGEIHWGPDGQVQEIYVPDEHRRKGVGCALLEHARSLDPGVHHSTDLSEDGLGFARATPQYLKQAGISDQPDNVTGDYSLAEYLQWCAHNHKDPADTTNLAQYAAVSGMDNEDYLDIYLFIDGDNGLFRQGSVGDGPQRLLTLADIAPHLGIDRFTLYQLADPKKRSAVIPTPTHRAGQYALWDDPEPWLKWNAIRKSLPNNLGAGGNGGGYKAGPQGGGWGDWAAPFVTGKEPIQLYTSGQIADHLGVHRNQVKYWANRAAAGLMAGPPPPHTHEMPRGDKGLTQRLWDDLDGWANWHREYHTKLKPGSPEVVRPGDADLLAKEFTPPPPKQGPLLPSGGF